MHAERTTVHVKRRRKLVTKMYVNDEGAMGKCFIYGVIVVRLTNIY